MRFLTRSVVRTLPLALALSLASAPMAECFAPPPGAEMPCCAGGHDDEACHQNPDAVQCCKQAQVQDSYGLMAAKPDQTAAQPVAVLLPVVAFPNASLVPILVPVVVDTSPPGRSTPLHVLLSVFLI